MKCERDSEFSELACAIYRSINQNILQSRLPKGTDVIFWCRHGDFQRQVFGKSFISDPKRNPLSIFAIVLSSNLITDVQTLLSVVLHEMCHCIQHLDGIGEMNHGPCFKKVVKSTIKTMYSQADYMNQLQATINCNINIKLLQKKVLNNEF